MPDKDPASQQQNNATTATVDTAALGASIADGIAKNLAPILERSSAAPRSEPAAPPPAPVTLPEPSYEEITAAQEAGDFKTATKLMQQRERARDARNQSAFDQLRNQGASALSSMARQAAASLPHYTRFQKEIDEMIADFSSKQPGVMITPDHYKTAHDIIAGRHVDDFANERTEAALRKARETPPAPEPGNEDVDADGEKLPASVAEEFKGTPFIDQFKQKQRAVGGRSFEQEVQIMNRGIKAARLTDDKGRPKRDYTEKDYLKERREMAAIFEDNPHLGLDE
jgi:hypothetical protein